jgi:conjugal transfer pilus assembly protein TraI
VLDELIKRSAALVIDRDLRSSAERYGKPMVGAHLERYLVDALRRLVASNPAWRPNCEKSRVWFGRDGLFVVWPNAAVDIRRLFEADRMAGVPQAPETILEILLSVGIVEPRSETQSTWSIQPPASQMAIEAIRLSSPAVLFAGVHEGPAPLDACLLTPTAQHESAEPALSAATNARGTEHAADDTPAQIPLDLTATTETTPTAPALAGTPEDRAPAPAAPRFRLNAPPRLNPPVRSALEQIVDSLNGSSSDAAAWTVPQGLFVPLRQLECRRVDPAIALRSLEGVGMLVTPSRGKARTFVHNFDGKEIVGVVVSPRFVGGLNPDDFTDGALAGG